MEGLAIKEVLNVKQILSYSHNCINAMLALVELFTLHIPRFWYLKKKAYLATINLWHA